VSPLETAPPASTGCCPAHRRSTTAPRNPRLPSLVARSRIPPKPIRAQKLRPRLPTARSHHHRAVAAHVRRPVRHKPPQALPPIRKISSSRCSAESPSQMRQFSRCARRHRSMRKLRGICILRRPVCRLRIVFSARFSSGNKSRSLNCPISTRSRAPRSLSASRTRNDRGGADLVEIGPIKLRLYCRGNLAENDSQTTDWSAEDTDATESACSCRSAGAALNRRIWRGWNSLSQRLLEIPDGGSGLEVCDALSAGHEPGNSVVACGIGAVGARRGRSFCARIGFGGNSRSRATDDVGKPGFSRRWLSAGGGGSSRCWRGGRFPAAHRNFSEAERGITAIHPCPAAYRGGRADILYTTVRHECGTLGLAGAGVTLRPEQYQKSGAADRRRRTTRDNAAIQHELQRRGRFRCRWFRTIRRRPGLEVAIGFEPLPLDRRGDYANVLTAPAAG